MNQRLSASEMQTDPVDLSILLNVVRDQEKTGASISVRSKENLVTKW